MEHKKLKPNEILKDLKEFVLHPKGFVFLGGKNGVGKTHIAMKIYERLSPYKLPAYDKDLAWFITQADLNMLFTEQHSDHGHCNKLLKEANYCKLFILDDLGTRAPSSAFQDFLYAIINHRWNNREFVCTVITSNLNSSGIIEYFGKAIFSRIASGRIYEVTGHDHRLKHLAV